MDAENVAPPRARARAAAPGKRARGLAARAPGKGSGAAPLGKAVLGEKASAAPRPRRALGDITNSAYGGSNGTLEGGGATGKGAGKSNGKSTGKGAVTIAGAVAEKIAKAGLEESGWEVEDLPKGADGAVAWTPPSLVEELLGGTGGDESGAWSGGLERGPLDELPQRLEKEELPFVACDSDGSWGDLEVEDEDSGWVGVDADLSLRVFELPPISFGDGDDGDDDY